MWFCTIVRVHIGQLKQKAHCSLQCTNFKVSISRKENICLEGLSPIYQVWNKQAMSQRQETNNSMHSTTRWRSYAKSEGKHQNKIQMDRQTQKIK